MEIPSKWDIIPIHNSDRASFKRCRRYWDWSSPARNNYTVNAEILGISKPLFFGTGIHWALEQYYKPTTEVRRDPVEAFTTWFDIQWNGGVVTSEWLPRVYDLRPQMLAETAKVQNGLPWMNGGMTVEDVPLYRVRGLEDILPDPDHNEYDELRELGVQMMKFYKAYAEKHDDFEVVQVEHDFSVPVWDYEKNCILTAIDTREDSPNYGQRLEVHARGRQDALKLNVANGKLGIIDYKTAERVGEEYFEKLETDEQCTNYLYAAQVEANYYGLPHKGEPLEEVLYIVLRKTYPKPPTQLKSGMFSTSRSDESTTFEMLMDWIEHNIPGIPLNEKQQAYVEYLRDVGDEQFVVRKSVRRNQHQIANAGQRLYLEAMDMLYKPRIYPNITNDWLCRNCTFRAPCLAKEDGGDWEQLLRDNYTTNKDR